MIIMAIVRMTKDRTTFCRFNTIPARDVIEAYEKIPEFSPSEPNRWCRKMQTYVGAKIAGNLFLSGPDNEKKTASTYLRHMMKT